MHRDKVICPMSYIQLKSWNVTVAYSHNYKTAFINALYYWGQKMNFLNLSCKFYVFSECFQSFLLFHNIQLHPSLQRVRKTLPLTKNTLSCNIEIFQIHILLYFHMAGLGSNLDHRNPNWKNTSRFGLKHWYKLISFSKFSWNWFFVPIIVCLFCLSFKKY